jgi:cell division septation protein DedD
MDLSGLIDVPPVMRSPLGQSPAPANDQKPVRATAPTFDRVHAPSTGALGLGKPAAPPAVTQPEPHAGQADRAPFDRVHAPSTGTLRLEKPAALPAVAQPEPHAGQADQAPFDRDLAPSRGTLGLGRAQDGYDELRGSVPRETRKRGVVLLTAAIAIAAAIAVGAGLWQFRGMLQDLAGSATVVHVPSPAAPAPMVAPGAQRPLEAALSAAEVPAQPAASAAAERPAQPAAPAASVNASVPDASMPYIIQVALFASVQRADRLIDELTQAGFRAYHGELVLGTAHLQQVLVGPYATRAEAEADRDRIRLIPGYQDARVAPAPPAKPSQ